MTRSIRVALVAAALALSLAARLQACSCLGPRPLDEERGSASAVFTGRVTGIKPAGDGLNVIVTMTPLLRWKGGLDATVVLATGANDGLCGCHFEIGGEYLVFAWPTTTQGQEMLFTHLCSRTAIAAGNPDIQSLGAPLTPTPARATSWGAVKRVWR
jgi:hypothetical protein